MPVQRDPGTTKNGTAVITGHVRSADGRPLRRAQIRATSGDPREAVTTTTGLEGEYELTELPAGRYILEATRSGYLRVEYGAANFGERGTPIEVRAGSKVAKIDFLMPRAGVVSGRVTDETGEAVAGVDIRAMQMQFYRGRKRIVPVSTWPVHVDTDDSGQYRLTGLPPGEYFISGRLRESWMSDDKEPQMLSYAPTYFPGTSEISEARRVKITAGQEAGAIDFMLVPMRAASLSGTAGASNGNPLTRGRIVLSQEIMGPTGGSSFPMTGSGVINDDGTWRIRDVAPGEYLIRATGAAGDGPSEMGALPVTVSGADMEGLVISADPGGLIAGRIITDTGEPLPSSASRVRVAATSVSFSSDGVPRIPGQDDGVAGADGAFTRKSVSGPVVIRVFSLPPVWAVKSLRIGSRDYTGLPVDVPPGQTLGDVTIVVSSRLPSLSGHAAGDDGKSADATVVLFPVDPARWIEAAANQRMARPDRTGTYTFEMVRPGEYFVVALTAIEPWQMNDPEFLSTQRERATKITVGVEPVTLDLKVVRR